jgi:hypothetical protein
LNAGRALALAAGLVLGLAVLPANAADWHPVPGAPELALDLETMQMRGAAVATWVRGLPLTAIARIGVPLPPGAKWHRTLARLQLDCRSRTAQALGVLGYDSAGRLVHGSSVPGARSELAPDGELIALFDASCELARSQA